MLQEDQRTLLDGTLELAEQFWVDKSGAKHWAHTFKVPIKGKNGQNRGLVALSVVITGRKEAEAARQESEGKYRDLVETSQHMIWRADKEGRFTYLNPTWKETLGYDLEEMLGRPFTDFKKPAEADRTFEDRKTILGGGKLSDYETIYLSKSGQELAFIFEGKPIFDRGGKIVGTQGTAQDITGRKRAEEAQRESENLLNTFFEVAPLQLAIKDKDGRYVSVNQNWCDFHGTTPQAVLGRLPTELPFGSKARFFQIYQEDQKTAEFGTVDLPEIAEVSSSGETQWFHIIKVPIKGHQGEFRGLVSMALDVSERKRAEEALRESEEKLRAMADNSPAQMNLKDLEQRYTLVNRQFEIVHGISSKEALGKKTEDLFPSAYTKKIVAQEKEVLRTGQTIEWELETPLPDGSKMTVINTKFPIRDDNNKITGVGTITTDISYRKALEEQLRQSQKMEALGTLAGGIAHDFNNILYPIIGFSDLLLEKMEASSEEYLYLTHIAGSARRAKDLVSQILLFSRHSQTAKSVCDLVPVAKEVIKLMRSTLPKTISIKEEVSKNQATVFCDPSQIHQVLLNLCVNAGQAISGIGEIKTALETLEFEGFECFDGKKLFGKYVRLAVSDSGVGMDEETRSQIFDPFFTTREVGKGTGLGLSTVFGIIQNHGGGIAVSSEPGKGATFEIFLPLAEGNIEKLPDTPEPVRDFGSEHILFVDDEEAITKLGRISLERLGYKVTVVSDGPKALEIFTANPDRFNLVVTDQTMPNMTGETLAHELLKLRPDLPIILCTGHSEVISPESSKAIGITTFLYKPITPNELGRAVREVLHQAKEIPPRA